MTKASEKELSTLHSQVAKAMSKALEDANTAEFLLRYYDAEETQETIPSKIRDFLEEAATVSPSLLTAITKFLKDNEITAQPEDEEMNSLAERLKNKPRRSTSEVKFDA